MDERLPGLVTGCVNNLERQEEELQLGQQYFNMFGFGFLAYFVGPLIQVSFGKSFCLAARKKN